MRHTTLPSGFTLIEMLVSLSLFTIVATIATGTLLSLIGSNSRIVDEQVVISGLSFALDSMTREIRTGSEYYCNRADIIDGVNYDENDVRNCGAGETGLSFREGGESISDGSDNKRIAYYLANGAIMRRIGNSPAEQLTGAAVRVTELRFFVEGTEPLTLAATPSESVQPTVTIVVTADATNSDLQKTFTIQSTVTQRALDI